MSINKKAMVSSICILTVISLLMTSGCGLIPDIPGTDESADGGCLYLDGKKTEISAPQRETSAYLSYNELQKLIYSSAYTALISGYNTFKLGGVNYNSVFAEYESVLSRFFNDYPEFFWLNGYVEVNAEYVEGSSLGSVTVTLGIYEHWKNADLESARAEFTDELKRLVHEASVLEDDYAKAKFVHDTLIKNTYYDYDSYNAGKEIDSESNAVVNSAYGPLVDGRAMCGGYSRAYLLVLSKLGIEADYVTGDADGGPHAWNSVKLGDSCYFVDLTWDDTDGEPCEIIYYYFCIDREDLEKTHSVDAEFSNIDADSEEFNYYVREELYLEEYDFDKLDSMWTCEANEGMLTVRFRTTAEMDKAYEDLIRSSRIYELSAMKDISSYQYMISNEFNILTVLYE